MAGPDVFVMVLAVVVGCAVAAVLGLRLRGEMRQAGLVGGKNEGARGEAESLARLLVAEIALYHADDRTRLLASGETSAGLVQAVVAARSIYEARIAPSERAQHFEAAVVAVLGNGQPESCAGLLDPPSERRG
jgi:hypothetical protein